MAKPLANAAARIGNVQAQMAKPAVRPNGLKPAAKPAQAQGGQMSAPNRPVSKPAVQPAAKPMPPAPRGGQTQLMPANAQGQIPPELEARLRANAQNAQAMGYPKPMGNPTEMQGFYPAPGERVTDNGGGMPAGQPFGAPAGNINGGGLMGGPAQQKPAWMQLQEMGMQGTGSAAGNRAALAAAQQQMPQLQGPPMQQGRVNRIQQAMQRRRGINPQAGGGMPQGQGGPVIDPREAILQSANGGGLMAGPDQSPQAGPAGYGGGGPGMHAWGLPTRQPGSIPGGLDLSAYFSY